jgi:6-phospho-beta-glucosidase
MSKEAVKVVTIGGGSSYTPELIEGFIVRKELLPLKELWLVDVEEGRKKVEIIAALARRMFQKAGMDVRVEVSLDRRKALPGADFVTTQFRVGFMEARIKDERIPLSHGVMGQETNGAGGMLKAFRTIPVILEIVRDIQELCPNAWMINFTNPAGINTEAVFRHTGFQNIIGLCNVPIAMVNGFARILGVDPNQVTLQIQGVNHNFFTTDVFVDGISVMKQLLETYTNLDASNMIQMKNIAIMPFSPGLIRGLQAIPCPYHNYYINTKEMLDRELAEFTEGNVRGEAVMKLEQELFEIYKDPDLDVKPKQLEQRGGAHYSDAACNLITSLYNDRKDIQYVNTLNKGTITNLPYDSVIEAACVITADGPVPLRIGEMKPQVAGIIQNLKNFERLVIEAGIKGDRDLALAAMAINPLCPSDSLNNIILEELLEAHRKYLPQFFG